jgi:hypothetical protein
MFKSTVIIVAGATVGLFFLYLKPSYATITNLRNQEKKTLDMVAQFVESAKELERLKSIYQDIKPQDMAKLESFLQEQYDPTEFVLYVHRIAENYGLTITNFDIKGTIPARSSSNQNDFNSDLFDTTTFSFNVSTSYKVFIALLKDLERSLKPLDITEISFTSSELDDYNFRVTLQTYWLKK